MPSNARLRTPIPEPRSRELLARRDAAIHRGARVGDRVSRFRAPVSPQAAQPVR